jgi:3-phenylpropionate/cinnamic acid dioxygenase small subunit
MTDDALADLETRVKRTEDLMEIHQLFIDYGMHLDAGRFDAYAALFAREGVAKMGPMGTGTGPAEIEALMSKNLDGLVGKTFHIISSPMVELDSDSATAEVMWTMIQRDDENAPELAMLGRHRDKLVREDGRWRIAERKGLIDVPSVYPGG